VRIAEACDVFIRHCGSVRKLSEHTTRAYRLDLKPIRSLRWRNMTVASCDRATVQRYVEHPLQRAPAPRKLRRSGILRPSDRSSTSLRTRGMFPKSRFVADVFGFDPRSDYGN
jgi:site-specific recombinase XerD